MLKKIDTIPGHIIIIALVLLVLALTLAIDPRGVKITKEDIMINLSSTEIATRTDKLIVVNNTKNKTCINTVLNSLKGVDLTKQSLYSIKLACDVTVVPSKTTKGK